VLSDSTTFQVVPDRLFRWSHGPSWKNADAIARYRSGAVRNMYRSALSPVVRSRPKSCVPSSPSNITLPDSFAKMGAIWGAAITWVWKSLNISFDSPATAWQLTHCPLPKNTSAPFFSWNVIAVSSPRAYSSIGASAQICESSNSAIAWPIIVKSIGSRKPIPNALLKQELVLVDVERSSVSVEGSDDPIEDRLPDGRSFRYPKSSGSGSTIPRPSSNTVERLVERSVSRDAVEPRHLFELRRRNEGLCGQEVGDGELAVRLERPSSPRLGKRETLPSCSNGSPTARRTDRPT
jgi:hypothetical protein